MLRQLSPRPYLYRLNLILTTLEGIAVFFSLFLISSEKGSARFWGLSASRLVIAGLVLTVVLCLVVLTIWALCRPVVLQTMDVRLQRFLVGKGWLLTVVASLIFLFLVGLYLVILFLPGVSSLLDSSLRALYARMQFLVIWIALAAIQVAFVLWLGFRAEFSRSDFFSKENSFRTFRVVMILVLLIATLFFAVVLAIKSELFIDFYQVLLPAGVLLIVFSWLYQSHRNTTWYRSYMIALVVFLMVFSIYRQTTYWVGRPNTPAKAYFHELAEAYLHGKLYLENVDQTHDLTFFNGNWYVANPPAVAILMLPIVALKGAVGLNTVVFSIFFGALNAALVFLILESMVEHGWSQLQMKDNLWLTLLFAFGTPHFYLAIVGKMWFMSQMVTITFFALAILMTMARRPAWSTGICLGIAMAARPNIALGLAMVTTVFIQLMWQDLGRIDWKKLFRWVLLASLPMGAAVLALLWYNWARFGNILDYGYVAENVADWMAGDLKNYGTFNPVFIARNLRVMLFNPPEWDPTCGPWAKHEGMSIFLVTPALIYLARSFRKMPLVIGAWLSTLLLIVPLALYYNTGAWQFGYKYLLDFILPVTMLLAVAVGKRTGWFMRVLILLSVAMNIFGVLWWFGLSCLRLQ
jgi:hypothetical protein